MKIFISCYPVYSLLFAGDLAVEGFTCLIIFKNMFSFGLTFKAYDWLVEGGIRETFIALASVQVVICLLSIPMCKSFVQRVPSLFRLS